MTESQMPSHSHILNVALVPARDDDPGGTKMLAATPGTNTYSTASPSTNLADAALSSAGGSQSHNNLQPYLAMNFIIALLGLYPSRS